VYLFFPWPRHSPVDRRRKYRALHKVRHDPDKNSHGKEGSRDEQHGNSRCEGLTVLEKARASSFHHVCHKRHSRNVRRRNEGRIPTERDHRRVGPPGQGPGSEADNFCENRDTQPWKKSPVTSAQFYDYCKRCSVLYNIDKNAAVNYAVCPSLPYDPAIGGMMHQSG